MLHLGCSSTALKVRHLETRAVFYMKEGLKDIQ